MKYNNSTFWPKTNIKQYDINSINANFNLVQWEWTNLETYEELLSFWTPYEAASEYNTKGTLEAALATPHAYHKGIIYSGLVTDNLKDYLTVDIGGEKSLAVKPGSIIYTIDLSLPLSDPKRYLVIENPVKKGYNYTIQNGIISFSQDVLNTWTRTIKGPTGASNWNAIFSFDDLTSHQTNENLLSFRIPISAIRAKNPEHPFTYTNAFSISFYSDTPSYENEVSIPHSAWVNYEENADDHCHEYYLYITFDVASTLAWRNLFFSGSYQLLIW